MLILVPPYFNEELEDSQCQELVLTKLSQTLQCSRVKSWQDRQS